MSLPIEYFSVQELVRYSENVDLNDTLTLTRLTPENPLSGGGGGYFPPPIVAILLHYRQQKTYQETLGTLRWSLIGSRTRLRTSMDPTGPLKWTSKFSSLF